MAVAGVQQRRGACLVLGEEAALLQEQHAVRQLLDQRQRLPSLVAHQAHRRLLHHAVQQHQVLVLQRLFLGVHEVVPQVILQLGALLLDVREVYEEARAHVPLQSLYVVGARGAVVLHQQVAVLQEPATANLLGVPRGYQLLVQVVQCFLEVSVHGLAHDRRVEVLADGQLAALVK